MSTFVVTTSADIVNAGDGVLSLREALRQANATVAEDRIEFDEALAGATLSLARGQLAISQDLTVDGSGVALDAQGLGRVLDIQGAGTDVRLGDLRIYGGDLTNEDTGPGGGINSGLARNSSSSIANWSATMPSVAARIAPKRTKLECFQLRHQRQSCLL